VAMHTPSEVKAAVTGSGRADKAQVTTMVTRLLKLSERPRPADGGGRAGAGDLPLLAQPDADEMQTKDAGEDRRGGVGDRPVITSPRCPAPGDPDRVWTTRSGRGGRRVGLAGPCAPRTPLANLRTGSPGRLATSLIVREDSLTL